MRKFAILVTLSVVAWTVGSDAESQKPKKKPQIGDLTLVYNVNNSGYIDVCGCKRKKVRNGSLTRRSSYLKQLRSTGRTLLLLDGGSTLFAIDKSPGTNRDDVIRKAKLIVEAYNRMGYRAMAVGVSDISMGLDTLKELASKAKFDVLSANFTDGTTRKPIFKPYAIYQVNGVRVGVVGLTLDTMGRAYLEKNAPGVLITDPLEAAKRVVSQIREKCDLIVALSHVQQESNFELMAELQDVGIVVDPYIEHKNHRTWIKEEEWLSALDDTLFLRTDGQGARLGVIDLSMDRSRAKLKHRGVRVQLESAILDGTATDEQKAELASYEGKNSYDFQRVAISPHHGPDPDIDKLVEEWKKGIDPSKVARSELQLTMRDQYVTTAKCKTCHEAQHEFWLGTKHSKAVASLVKTGDQHRYDCIGCHSLGYGTAFLDTSKIGPWAEVQCESCHGPNRQHLDNPQEFPFAKIRETTCLACHNKEHTLKEFRFVRMRRKVACPKG